MKKFSVTIAQNEAREVNANEYSVSPKLGAFDVTVCGKESKAWTTSGKGKSAINNHYIYFKDGATLYYFKSNAVEVEQARKGFSVSLPGAVVQAEPEQTGPGLDAELAESMESPGDALPAPKASRRRSRK